MKKSRIFGAGLFLFVLLRSIKKNLVKKKIIILLFLLTFPSIFYVLLSTGKVAHFINLPYFGEKIAGKTRKDTIYHSVPAFEFVNEDGKKISDKTLDGKIYVANYFSTTDNSIVSKKIIAELLRVQEKDSAWASNILQLVSFSYNPETDSVGALKAYSNMVHADNKMWNFVTGDKNKLMDLAKNGFLLNILKGTKIATDTIHTEQLVLIDKQKHIRGIYDGGNIKEINNLLDDIKMLIAADYINENKKKHENE